MSSKTSQYNLGDEVVFLSSFDRKDVPEDSDFIPKILPGCLGKVTEVMEGELEVKIRHPFYNSEPDCVFPEEASIRFYHKDGDRYNSWNGQEARLGKRESDQEWYVPGLSVVRVASFETPADPLLSSGQK